MILYSYKSLHSVSCSEPQTVLIFNMKDKDISVITVKKTDTTIRVSSGDEAIFKKVGQHPAALWTGKDVLLIPGTTHVQVGRKKSLNRISYLCIKT